MIDWNTVVTQQGFKTEKQMWTALLTALRNSDAIAKHLGVSRGAVQRRRTLLKLNKPAYRNTSYRKAGKRAFLDRVPDTVIISTIEDIQSYILDVHGVLISTAYISKYKRKFRKV